MAITLFVLWILLTALFVIGNKFGGDYFISWLAEQDKWWSPLRKLPGGGHLVFYTKGKSPGGDYATFLHGHIPEWRWRRSLQRFFQKGTPEFNAAPRRKKSRWSRRLERLGVAHVGFFRQEYKRPRRWEAMDIKEVNGKPVMTPVLKETKKGEEHIFYFATTMTVRLENVPTKETGSVRVKITFNVLLVDPPKAEFTAGKWEIQANSAVHARAREHISRKSLDELQKEWDTQHGKELVDHILLANEKQEGESGTVGLVPEYGVMIQGPRFEDFDFVEEGGAQDIIDAKRRFTVAKQDLKTEKVKADTAEIRGQGRARERTAEAAGIRQEAAAWASVTRGADIAMAEAIKEAKPSVVSVGQAVPVAVEVPTKPRDKK